MLNKTSYRYKCKANKKELNLYMQPKPLISADHDYEVKKSYIDLLTTFIAYFFTSTYNYYMIGFVTWPPL